jgi:co-chaperonin GroES (HSP10)
VTTPATSPTTLTTSPDLYRPLGNRIALRRLTDQPFSNHSTYLVPEAGKEKPQECEVVAIPAATYVTDYGTVLTCPVAVGDTVLIGKYVAGEHRVRNAAGEEEEVLYVRWEELLAVRPGPGTKFAAQAAEEASQARIYAKMVAHVQSQRAVPRRVKPDQGERADTDAAHGGSPNPSDL